MPKLSDLEAAIKVYQKSFRNETMGKYEPSKLYDLFPELGKPNCLVEHNWPQKWPHLDNAGIYALLSENLEVLYIGKASMNHGIGYRLSSYCSYVEGTKKCKLNDEWEGKPRYVYSVAVPDQTKFEAPALEEYLIKEIQTANNKAGV